jgi:WD40 repeat protein
LNGTLQILNVSYPDNYGSDESKPLATKSGGVLSVGAGEVTALAAMDERNFAVAIGSKVVICDCKQGKKGEVVHEGKIGVTCLAISPAAKKLALAFGNTVRMYNWESTTPTTDQHEHSAPVTALAFDKEGKILASGDSLGKIRVWPVNE